MPLSKNISVFLTLNTKQFQSQITKTTKSMRAFGTSMQSIGSSITRNFSIPFSLIGGYAVKAALDFDTSLTKMRTLVGLTKDEVLQFKNAVLDLSGKTAQAPADLASGLYFLTSAGLEGKQALEALNQVSKGVAIQLGEQSDLATVAAAAQNAYGIEVLSSSEALDVFGQMVKTGMFESSELSKVLGKELGVASALKISMQELGAMISTYTRITGDANSATVGASGVLFAFEKQTLKGEKALDKIGMTYETLRHKLGQQGLQKTLLFLNEAFEKNNIRLTEFFGKQQAAKVVLGILGNQTEDYVDILNQLNDSTGFVNDGFEIVAETGGFKLKQAFQQLKNSLLQLGETLVPVVLKFSEFITNLVRKFQNLNPETKEFVTQLAVAFAVGGPILTGIGFLISNLATVTTAMAKFVLNNPKLALMAAAIGLIAYYWDDVKVAIAQVANYMIDLYNNSAFVRGMLNGTVSTLATMGGIIVTIFNLISNVFNYAVEKIARAANTVTSFLSDLSSEAGFMFEGMFDFKHQITSIGDPYAHQRYRHEKGMDVYGFGKAGTKTPTFDTSDIDNIEAKFIEDSMNDINDFMSKVEKMWTNTKEEILTGKIDIEVSPDDIQKGVDNIKDNITSGMKGLFDELLSMMGMGDGFDAIGGGGGEEGPMDVVGGDSADVVLGLDLEEQKGKFQTFVDDIKTSWLEGVKLMNAEFERFITAFGDGMANALSTAIVEGQSMKDAFRDFMKSMTQEVLKMIIKTLVLRTIMKALGLPVGAMSLGAGLDAMAGVQSVGDIAFGPSSGRYIVGPEGAFSLSPNDSIIAGTNLFGGGGGPSNMTVDGYIDGSSIMLSNQRETNTTNRLS